MSMLDAVAQMLVARAKNDPKFANNPVAQQYLQVIESGDAEAGRRIAENLCKTNGVTPNQAIGDAKKFFNI